MAMTSVHSATKSPVMGRDGLLKVFVVGIDIGMTCTGVAICSYNKSEPCSPIRPVVIQRWPGSNMLENKVPTKVAYKAACARNPHSWGFECPPLEDVGPAMAVKDLFKFYLDERFLRESFERNPQAIPGTIEDVKLWYRDFLSVLHAHISSHLTNPPWLVDLDSTKVEYIFGLPTSWKDDVRLVKAFTQVVGESGFGTNNVIMGLTEGEAAAVYTAKNLEHKYKEGDALIVCDAGGGTTDMCVLKVNRINGEHIELENLDKPKVLGVGSLDIDDMFEKEVAKRLSILREKYPQLSEHVAHQMTRGEFQAIKTSFGTAGSVRIANILVPGLPRELDERVELSRDELKAMFDEQIRQIFEFIDNELVYLQWAKPDLKISYLVLSGGLGSSKYVQAEVTNHYDSQDIKVLFAKESEELPLAVCKGLVIDRMQQICYNTSVIRIHPSRASYGILCREPYDKKHLGQSPVKNPLDNSKYAENKIDWLIRIGEKIIEGEPIARKYSRIVSPGGPNKGWRFGVVTSILAADELPPFWDGNGDLKVTYYTVSDFEPSSDKEGVIQKRKHLIGPKFLQVKYDLLAFMELEEPRVEIRVNGDAQALTVQQQGSQPTEGGEGNRFQDGFIMGL